MNFFVVLGFALVALAGADVVQFQQCPNESSESLKCTVHEVRVNPCKEAAEGKPCRIKRGNDASIEFDYTANFQGETLESRAFWSNQIIDLPFLGMETNACLSTVCPVQPGTKQTYAFALPISKKYPARTFDVKWKLWNKEEQNCCFVFQIKLHK